MTERRERPEWPAIRSDAIVPPDEAWLVDDRGQVLVRIVDLESACPHGLPTTFDSCSRCIRERRELR